MKPNEHYCLERIWRHYFVIQKRKKNGPIWFVAADTFGVLRTPGLCIIRFSADRPGCIVINFVDNQLKSRRYFLEREELIVHNLAQSLLNLDEITHIWVQSSDGQYESVEKRCYLESFVVAHNNDMDGNNQSSSHDGSDSRNQENNDKFFIHSSPQRREGVAFDDVTGSERFPFKKTS